MPSDPARPPGAVRSALYLLLAHAAYLGVPVLVYTAVGAANVDLLRFIHYAVASAYLVTTAMMLVEARTATPRQAAPVPAETFREQVPLVTVIIPAYLPISPAATDTGGRQCFRRSRSTRPC